jgi:WD40 repeat protein
LLADALNASQTPVSLSLASHLPTLSTARIMLQYMPLSRSLLCFSHGAFAIVRVVNDDGTDDGNDDDVSVTVTAAQRQLRLFVHSSHSCGQLWPVTAVHPRNDTDCLLVCTMQSIVLSVTAQSPHALDPTHGVRCVEPSLLCCASFSPRGDELVGAGTMFGDLLIWNAADGAIVQRCSGHEGSVRCVQWSADACTILTASEDRSLRVWRRANSSAAFVCAASLFGHDGRVWSCSLFPSGDAFCSGGEDGGVRQWSMRTPTITVERADVCHAADVWQVDSCRVGDGLVLMASVSRDGTVRVARSSSPSSPAVCDNALFDTTVVIAAPANMSTVRICPWTASMFVGFANGSIVRLVGSHSDRRFDAVPLGDYGGRGVAYLSVCDNGALLLVGTNVGDLVLVRVQDGSVVAEVRGAHRDRVRFCTAERVNEDVILILSSAQGDGLAISTAANGVIAAAGPHTLLPASGSAHSKFGAACVFSATVARSQRCVVAGDSNGALHLIGLPAPLYEADSVWNGAIDVLQGGTVSLRSVHDGDRVTAISIRQWTPRAIVVTSFGRDGCCAESMFALDDAGVAVRATLLRRFRLLAGVLPPTNLLRCENVHDGVVSVLYGRTFAAVDIESVYAHAGAVLEATSLGVVYDCAVVNGVLWALHPAVKGTVRVAATRVAAPLLPLVHSQYVDAAHYAAPLVLAFTGGEDTRIGVWDAREHRLVQFLHSHSGAVFCFADDGATTLLSGGARGSVCEHTFERRADGAILTRQCNVSGWTAVAEALGPDCRVIALAAWRAPTGRLRVVIGTADGRLLCFESDSDGVRAVGTVVALRSAIFSLASIDGGELVVCGAADGGVRVLNTETGALVRLQAGHQSGVTALSVAALEGRSLLRICSGGDDQALLVADYDCAAEWRCVRLARVPLAHGGAVRAVTLSGERAVTASADERVAQWHIHSATEALTIERVSVQLSGVEETSGAALCENAVLVVGNGATFVQLAV